MITFFVSSFITAYMLRVFERPLSEISGQNFDSFYTSFWCVIITMTTVGYGEVYPKTIFGRLLGIALCIWGALQVSLFVVTVSRQLELTQLQSNAYVLIQRLSYRDALKKVAASALFSMFKFSKAIKGNKDKEGSQKPKVLTSAETNFKRKMLIFKNKTSEMRKFSSGSSTNENMILFWDEIEKFRVNQTALLEQQDQILELLGTVLKEKGVDFDEFIKTIEEDEIKRQNGQDGQDEQSEEATQVGKD